MSRTIGRIDVNDDTEMVEIHTFPDEEDPDVGETIELAKDEAVDAWEGIVWALEEA